MLRTKFQEKLKTAMQEQDKTAVNTIRLILAVLKDRDIAARSKGNTEGISNDEILSMLQTMIKQRRESIKMYQQGGREELAAREQKEIEIIKAFLPKQLDESEIEAAVDRIVKQTDAQGVKDMGRVMGALKKEYTGQMDFAKASSVVKEKLAALI